MAPEFTHLHLHTDYSLLDGACDVDKLVAHVDKIGQKAVAMTDHGNIFGAVHFFDAAKKKGIKPILGCELYICQAGDHRAKGDGDKYNHLLVLAENEEGYRNLVRLTSEAALHGFYRKPRVSKAFLAKHSKGLIGFSGCLAGEVSQHIMAGDYDKAKATAGAYQEIFGRGNYFLEVQDHHLEPDKAVIEAMFRMEQDLAIPLIATNDSHYIEDQDARSHDVLLCVQTASSVTDPKRFRFGSEEFYIKTAEEMARVFPDHPHVLSGTMQFPERCNLKLNPVSNPFPDFPVPEGYDLDGYFEQVCREGLKKRLDTNIAHLRSRGLLRKTVDEYHARLDREIDCIKAMKFPGYFMIVWDFIRYAREQNIPVGPGRGSAAGSLVAYCMEITDVDPLQNDLLFERFLNPERISMPDIDIDFCMNRRGEVIEYVRRKYGNDQVAQIITFNTMAAKAAIKDVGRAMDMPYGEVDRIAKMIPGTIGITIEQALKDRGPLQQAYQAEPAVKSLIDTAMRLEGLVRGAGVHAAGVVIAPQPLTELVPVTRTKDDAIVTSYDMKAVEKMGLLKMDFLGLTTLTVIDDCLKLIHTTRGETLDMATVPLDDERTFTQVFHRALTSGVFQFESGGMRDVLRRYKPNSIEHLTALNALYRPGPMDMIDDFIERKWGRREVAYLLPELEPLLKETLGVIVYQEQVMQISNAIGGYSLGAADLLRRAMGKKDAGEMAKQRVIFMAGAAERKFARDKAGELFDLMEKFAGYGFNKSHSAAYSLLAYHTAYLKTHYPVEFMAALLTSETSKPENVVKYISECREMNIPVVPPSVQVSDANFTPVKTPAGEAIGFGLAAIKNVGHNAIVSIIEARAQLVGAGKPGFASLWEFCESVDLRLLNKRVLESLIKAGAMDCFGKRASVMAALDSAIERAQKAQKDKAAGQHGLFGIFDSDVMPASGSTIEPLPNAPEWDEHTRLQNEKDVLGFFVSGHPMDKYREKLRNMKVVDTATACEMKPEPQVFRRGGGPDQGPPEIQVAGVITGLKVAKSKRSGEFYAQATLEDTVGKIELIAFPKDYEKLAEKLKIDVPVVVRGALRGEEDSAPKLAVSAIQALEDVKLKLPDALRIKVPLHSPDAALLDKLKRLFADSPGTGKLLLDFEEPGEFCAVLEPSRVTVAADRLFIDRVEELVGRGAVRVIQ